MICCEPMRLLLHSCVSPIPSGSADRPAIWCRLVDMQRGEQLRWVKGRTERARLRSPQLTSSLLTYVNSRLISTLVCTKVMSWCIFWTQNTSAHRRNCCLKTYINVQLWVRFGIFKNTHTHTVYSCKTLLKADVYWLVGWLVCHLSPETKTPKT